MEIDRLNLPSGSDDPGSHQQFDPKRNKITRACDLCRKRKVKCDGFNPCASCLHNDMPCTFIDEPKKYPQKGPKYVQSLEERLERMESLIKELVPNMATEIDLIVGNSKRAEKTRHSSPRESLIQESPRSDLSNNRSKDKGPEMIKEITVVEALSDSFDGLLLKEDGCSTRYIGSHSIVSMFSEAGEQVQKYLPNRDIMSDLAKGLSNARSSQVKYDHTAMFALLPSRNVADIFVKYFLEITNVISPMFHASAFLEEFENSWKDANTMMDPVWLGTYLTVLAVGAQLYAVEQGLSLRKELEIMSSKWSDAVWNMQNELVMIRNYKAVRCLTLALIYMPVHTNPRPCWVALGMIVQSSLLVGLHRHGEGWNFNPIESQERRVTFWTIYMLDKYFSSVVGLPSILQDDDIDQRLPYEADYNCITKDGIFPGENTCSKQLKMFIHLIKIAQIQSKIQKKVYRVIRTDKDIEIMNDHVITIDNEVTAWHENCGPQILLTSAPSKSICSLLVYTQLIYHHTLIILHQQSLLLSWGRGNHKVPTSAGVHKHSQLLAGPSICLEAARQIIQLLSQSLDCSSPRLWLDITYLYISDMILFTSITKNPSELSSKGDIELMRDSISYIRTKYKSKSWESTQVVLRIEKLISIALQIQETNTAATNDKKPNSTGKSKSEEPSVSTGNIPDDLQSFNLARNPSGQLDLLRIETLPKLQPSEWFSLSGNTPSTAAFSPWPFSNDDLCFINPEKAVDSSSMKYTPNLFMDDLKQYHISSILKSDPFYGL